MEYASGNYGMLDAALAYGADTTPPVVDGDRQRRVERDAERQFTSNEASSIYYTLDGSTPTTASTEWKPPRARALPLPISIADDATLKWIATDFKGNVRVGSKSFLIETDKPTVTLNGFTEGRCSRRAADPGDVRCADEAGGSGSSCVGRPPRAPATARRARSPTR